MSAGSMEYMDKTNKEAVDIRKQRNCNSPQSSFLDINEGFTIKSSTLSVRDGKEESESMAEASFAGDAGEKIEDPCAVCFTNHTCFQKASHFCSECGYLGHFLCEKCLGFHKKFTNHKSVKSLRAAKYKRSESFAGIRPELENEREKFKNANQELMEKEKQLKSLADIRQELENEKEKLKNTPKELAEKKEQLKSFDGIRQELENEREKHKNARQELTEKDIQLKELGSRLQQANIQIKTLSFRLQLTEDTHQKIQRNDKKLAKE